jgi:hypothetical protein
MYKTTTGKTVASKVCVAETRTLVARLREGSSKICCCAGLPSRRKVFARLIGHSTRRPHTLPLSGRTGLLQMLPFSGGAFLQHPGRSSNWKITPNSDSFKLGRCKTPLRTKQTTDRRRNGPPTSIKSGSSVFCLQIYRSPSLRLFIFPSTNRDRSSRRRSRRASSSSATTTHTRQSHKTSNGEILVDDDDNYLPGHTTGTTTSFRRARRGTFPRRGRRKAIWRGHHHHHYHQFQRQYQYH